MTCECRDDVPEYTLDDVSQHYNEESCWIVYLNKVYDITSFMVEASFCPWWITPRGRQFTTRPRGNKGHPGGFELLLEHAGNDATSAFQEAGHSQDARKLLAKYFIGNLAKEEVMYKNEFDEGCVLCSKTSIKEDTLDTSDIIENKAPS